MRLIYLAHPVSGLARDVLIDSVSAWLRDLTDLFPDYAFCVTWLPYVLALDDGNQAHRTRGMRDDLECLGRCDAVWLVGDRVSSGMLAEALHARKVGKHVSRVTRSSRGIAVVDWDGRTE
jgi:hypothetical protein